MSVDPDVMRYLMPIPTRADADAWIARQQAHLAEHGFGLWAVSLATTGDFIGAVGLVRIGYEAHFTPAVEVGWRLARSFWGLGYAPEAAEAALRFAFTRMDLHEIVANTVPENVSSRRVMEKLGMTRDPADDFDHPRIPLGHGLRRQVLYRLTRDRWMASRAAADGITRTPPARAT
jgi:RimJ/RimL family protein N-acetyltransferase